MSLAIHKAPISSTTYPKQTPPESSGHTLNIAVVFTSVESTLAALREAGALANSLEARIQLIVPQVVPYPLPVEAPPVPKEVSERHFRVIAGHSPVETCVRICLCRDRFAGLQAVLEPGAIVVIGGRKSWWPTKNARLAKRLRAAGYEVIFKETE